MSPGLKFSRPLEKGFGSSVTRTKDLESVWQHRCDLVSPGLRIIGCLSVLLCGCGVRVCGRPTVGIVGWIVSSEWCSRSSWLVVLGYYPNCFAMEKSSRLNGSAMLAWVGTRCRIWRGCCRLCHVQWAPMRLLRGICLPDPLMMAWVAASLSQSCM